MDPVICVMTERLLASNRLKKLIRVTTVPNWTFRYKKTCQFKCHHLIRSWQKLLMDLDLFLKFPNLLVANLEGRKKLELAVWLWYLKNDPEFFKHDCDVWRIQDRSCFFTEFMCKELPENWQVKCQAIKSFFPSGHQTGFFIVIWWRYEKTDKWGLVI